jgi:hypothetical protein
VLQFGHAEVCYGGEVLDGPESSGRALGLLEHAIHRFDVGVAAAIEHATHNTWQTLLERGGQLFERLKSAPSGPEDPVRQFPFGRLHAIALYGGRSTCAHASSPSLAAVVENGGHESALCTAA